MKCNTITEAVTSGSNTDDAIQSMIRLVAESWRFTRGVLRMAEKLDVVSQDRLANQARFFIRQLDDILTCHGCKIVNLEGHPFDVGVAAHALNLDDFSQNDALVVDQMLEPLVMGPEGVLRMGTVLLKKAMP